MKKIIITCITIGLFIIPLNLSADSGSIQKIKDLESKMNTLTNRIDNIVSSSRKVKDISERYKKIAMEHLTVVSDFTEQKGSCQNLEEIYTNQRSRSNLDKRVIRKQGKNLVNCYKVLETLIHDFENMSKDFLKLKVSIKTLNDMAETDQSSIKSLEKQSRAIESLIRLEKKKATLGREEVERAINESS